MRCCGIVFQSPSTLIYQMDSLLVTYYAIPIQLLTLLDRDCQSSKFRDLMPIRLTDLVSLLSFYKQFIGVCGFVGGPQTSLSGVGAL